jgi:hypothetical protein
MGGRVAKDRKRVGRWKGGRLAGGKVEWVGRGGVAVIQALP